MLYCSMWRRWHPQSPSPRPGAANPKRKLYSSPGEQEPNPAACGPQMYETDLAVDPVLLPILALPDTGAVRACHCGTCRGVMRHIAVQWTGAGLCALPCKRRCGPGDARQTSADSALAASMPSFTFASSAASPAGMQLDGDAAHARHGMGGTSHALVGGHELTQRGWDGAVASRLSPCALSCRGERLPLVVRQRPPAPEGVSGLFPQGQQTAQQVQDVDIRSPFPDALLASTTLPATGVRKALGVNPQRTPQRVVQHVEKVLI